MRRWLSIEIRVGCFGFELGWHCVPRYGHNLLNFGPFKLTQWSRSAYR